MRSCRDGLKVHVNVHECINPPPPKGLFLPQLYTLGPQGGLTPPLVPLHPVAFQVTRRSARLGFFLFSLLTGISSYWLYKSDFWVQEWIIGVKYPVWTWGTEQIAKPTRRQAALFVWRMELIWRCEYPDKLSEKATNVSNTRQQR